MSITKSEKAEGKLISQAGVDSGKLSAKSSLCSCENCDSASCFEKRTKAVCNRCRCAICRELRNRSIEPKEDSRVNKVDLESAPKKMVREVVTRETIESLKRVTMYEFDSNKNFSVIADRQSKVSDKDAIFEKTKSQCNKIDSFKTRPNAINEMGTKTGSCKQRAITEVPSTQISEPHKVNDTATKLSAQIMNVPYEEINETAPSPGELVEQNPLSKFNIFKRIKEIYEACSCKVCECISSKPRVLRQDFCECKPCQCPDCMNVREKIDEKMKHVPNAGCPCIRCDREGCKGIVKNINQSQACDCNPSDNMREKWQESLRKQCKCEPCQCIKCRSLGIRATKTVKLGTVDAYIQGDSCHCSPCECIECKHIYNRINPTVMCTHARNVNKQRKYYRCRNCYKERCQFGEIGACKCEGYNRDTKRMFNKNYNNYDIRTVIVDNNGPFIPENERKFDNHNSVALFASLKNSYPSSSCATGVCKCGECECIVCSTRDDSLKNYKENLRHDVMSIHNSINRPMPVTTACKCAPCECEVCSRRGENEDYRTFDSKCRCDVCDCINCDYVSLSTPSYPTTSFTPYSIINSQPAKPIRSVAINKNCSCTPCDCSNCKKLISCSSGIKFYPDGKSVEKRTKKTRKVMLITPSSSDTHFKSRKTYAESVSPITLSPKHSIEGFFRQDLSTCHAVPHNYTPIRHLIGTNKDQVCQLYQGNKGCNVVSNDEKELLVKLNNPILDTVSFKSIEETPVLDYPCDLYQRIQNCSTGNENNAKQGEIKCKSFNVIHEQPQIIAVDDSHDSLSTFWTSCNDSPYPINLSKIIRNTGNLQSDMKDDLGDLPNKTKNPDNNQDDLNERSKEETAIKFLEDHSETDSNNVFTKHFGRTYCNENYNYGCGSKYVNYSTESRKYTSSFRIHSDVDIDYERATRVLCEAKAFSSKLIKMLDSFETANRQFESASKKFKILHEPLLDINERDLNEKYNANFGIIQPYYNDTIGIIPEVNHDDFNVNNKCNVESVKDENEPEKEYEQSTAKPEKLYSNSQYTEVSTPLRYSSETKHDINTVENPYDVYVRESETKTILDRNNNMTDNSKSQPEFNNTDSKVENFSGGIPPNVSDFHNSRERNVSDESKTDKDNVTKAEKPTPTSVMNQLDKVLSNGTTSDTAVATDDAEINHRKPKEHTQPWQIFKKNLYLNDNTSFKRSIYQTDLELDIKEAIRAISLQTRNENYTKNIPRTNEALANLQSEVNDLLNMPSLQANSQFPYNSTKHGAHLFPRSKMNLELESMSSVASSQTYDLVTPKVDKEVYFNPYTEADVSCDQLKAKITGLRRVSDHTVLVKWNVPKRIEDVEGYELLVDGRTVQKIFSPTRRMAVVTCLPHAARVLLTIRTIASADCGHTPASTVVYRPKMK